jgi:hypothetical protein
METVNKNIVNEVSQELCTTIYGEVEDAKNTISNISKIVCSNIPVMTSYTEQAK